jgi:hypothetical protein
VIVLLTDGIQYEEPETALAVAAEARAAGVSIYAIGLGADVDGEYLKQIAGTPSRYYYAPSEGELEGIYREIARVIPCPPERFWRGRGQSATGGLGVAKRAVRRRGGVKIGKNMPADGHAIVTTFGARGVIL